MALVDRHITNEAVAHLFLQKMCSIWSKWGKNMIKIRFKTSKMDQNGNKRTEHWVISVHGCKPGGKERREGKRGVEKGDTLIEGSPVPLLRRVSLSVFSDLWLALSSAVYQWKGVRENGRFVDISWGLSCLVLQLAFTNHELFPFFQFRQYLCWKQQGKRERDCQFM